MSRRLPHALRHAAGVALAALLAVPWGGGAASGAEAADSLAVAGVRPFVAGGYDDRPQLAGIFGRIAVGGYLEAGAEWERESGATTALGAELRRWNLLASTEIRGRVQIFSEIEFEEGGEEVTVELAQVDVRFAPAFNARGGVLLLPLGRFNLAHDAPRNELPARPAEAEELLGVALSQAGFGAFGRFDRPGGARLTYEAYAVTGFADGLLLDSPEGTRLPAGKRNHEDANASPALVARVEWSPSRPVALGLSGYHGAWNVYRNEGLEVDERRDVRVLVADAEWPLGPLAWSGEAAIVEVDVPPTLGGLFAGRQTGGYLQVAWPFGRRLVRSMPGSSFALAARLDAVDFDRDLAGDSVRGVMLGINFRPVPETALKLACQRGERRDRFNNSGGFASVQLGLATYF